MKAPKKFSINLSVIDQKHIDKIKGSKKLKTESKAIKKAIEHYARFLIVIQDDK